MEKIGNGSNGTVFKLEKGSKIYALKRQKISEEQASKYKELFKNKLLIENIIDSNLKDIFFNKFINKINKIHFAILKKYNIVKCKNFEMDMTEFTKNDPKQLNKYNKLKDSKYCLDLIYDYKDGNLYQIFNKLNKNQFISMLIQILYALYLMHLNDFYHKDLRRENICFVKTNLLYIKIFNKKKNSYTWIYIFINRLWMCHK
jgi:serine/threonine protein kinase